MAILKNSVLGTALTGSSGSVVFAETMYGTVVRSRPDHHDARTTAQIQQRRAFARAQAEYRLLSIAENAAWKQYALSTLNINPDTGKPGGRTAYAAFLSLATRFASVHPDAPLPHLPPEFPYAGDPVRLTLSTQPNEIVITASAANSAETVTALELLPLKFASQAYRLREMRTVGYVQFTVAELSFSLDVAPGWYVLASNFVSTTTGQHTAHTVYPPIEVSA